MLQSKAFTKKTRHGKVLKVVREHYLRDDIPCGTEYCETCDKASARLKSTPDQILVIDTNVALHQIDLLENPIISNVVVLSVVLEELKNKNISVYNRLRAICSNVDRQFFVFANEHHRETFIKGAAGESPNDRNDRAIRVASSWYQKHVGGSRVLLITNDAENRRRAQTEGLLAETVQTYVQSLGKPELLDILALSINEEGDGLEDSRPAKRKRIYADHKLMSEITAGLHSGLYHQGKLRVSRYSNLLATVSVESFDRDVIIDGKVAMNRAFDGDVVAVEVLPEDEWGGGNLSKMSQAEEEEAVENEVSLVPASAEDGAAMTGEPSRMKEETSQHQPHGRVVGIIKRNWRQYCGSLQTAESGETGGTVSALFMAVERKIPKIRIRTRQLSNLLNKRIMVGVDSWEPTSQYPSGHYIRTIGDVGDRETESELLLLENDINTRPFSAQVMACVPKSPWSMPVEELQNPHREDFRNIRVFSVDPPGCTDIDDALSCTALPSGNLQVGVHIADVTSFVLPGTPLDDEGAERGTSTYLVERRINMLPKELTEDACSLRANVERLAFSVLWEMTTDADVVSVRFTKSVIKSCAAFTYEEAQARIDGHLEDPLTADLRNMNRLAKILRQRRMERGALTLASPEVKFQIDTETHNPLDVGMYQVRETNQMVEEFMLAANVAVAQKILKHFPTCSMLRRHPVPTPKMLEPLVRLGAAVGVDLDITSSRSLADSLDRAVGEDPYFNKLIRILATRCMTQALYFSSADVAEAEYHHYGLAAPLYTHFTSPIRRYADVIVHRLLAAALGISSLPYSLQESKSLTSIADNLNYRHRNAQMAGRASVELHTLIFFKNRPTDTEGRIVKVQSNGLVVFVPKYGIEGPVYFHEKEGKAARKDGKSSVEVTEDKEVGWLLNEETQTVSSLEGHKVFKVLDKVYVHIEVVEPQPGRRKLELTLIDQIPR